jgi:hypothetical protein
VADGARNAARGLRYQYLRTLAALMDAVDQPGSDVEAVHIEGRPEQGGAAANSIDYELSDSTSQIILAAQVKARAPGSILGASEVFGVLARLVMDRDAIRYELLTALQSGLEPERLRGELVAVLGSGSRQADQVSYLSDEHLTRLSRAHADFDPRDDWEVSDDLRSRMRLYRNSTRASLGEQSAGLLIGYLLAEIFSGPGRSRGAPAPSACSACPTWPCRSGRRRRCGSQA